MPKYTKAQRINHFEHALEEAGFDGAFDFVLEVLIPIATKDKDTIAEDGDLSLWNAARNHADSSADQDTSAYQLWLALTKIQADQDALWHD